MEAVVFQPKRLQKWDKRRTGPPNWTTAEKQRAPQPGIPMRRFQLPLPSLRSGQALARAEGHLLG